MFDPAKVRDDFPILAREVNGKPLIYLDSGATSQKPRQVIEAEREYYLKHNANVHRGAHTLGDEATTMLEQARGATARFINAPRAEEIIFVRNTTEAINLVAYAWGMNNLKQGDVVLSTEMEHHSNLVPWQQITKMTGATLKLVQVTAEGLLDQNDYKQKLAEGNVRMVAVTQVSNALGTINPIKEMARVAHQAGALILVDGAQAVPHMPVDVHSLSADFYAFSGHKMLAPMGIGVLWGRRGLLQAMPPFMTGGGMISAVYPAGAEWGELPDKFEAGTPNVAGAVGLAEAIKYLDKLGMENVQKLDEEMVAYGLQELGKLKEVEILGSREAGIRRGLVAFEYRGVHAHDAATILDSEGVAVRSGHHCTMVLHNKLGITASIRASFNVYTTRDDIDSLVFALGKIKKIFKT